MRIISYGGGVQSTAMLVLAVDGRIPPVDAALFANVGDDSEHPDTLRYVREVAQPWAASKGLTVHELHRTKRDGTTETLMGRLVKVGSRSLPIPVRMSNTGAPGTRSCTHDFKIQVVGKWLKANGASRKTKAEVCIGISWDEIQRIGNKKLKPYESVVYPLVDLRLTRTDCQRIIERAGLPLPPKSSCYFCPFHRPSTWARMRRDEPVLFWKSVDLERMLNERRAKLTCPGSSKQPKEALVWVDVHSEDPNDVEERRQEADPLFRAHTGTCQGCSLTFPLVDHKFLQIHERSPVYLTRFGKPLADVIHEEQPSLDLGTGPGAESCDDGYCWT